MGSMESMEPSGSKGEIIKILRDKIVELGVEAQNAPSDAQRETIMEEAGKLKRRIEALEKEAGL